MGVRCEACFKQTVNGKCVNVRCDRNPGYRPPIAAMTAERDELLRENARLEAVAIAADNARQAAEDKLRAASTPDKTGSPDAGDARPCAKCGEPTIYGNAETPLCYPPCDAT